jgi:hypothetical protein
MRKRVLLVAVALALVVAGCGSGKRLTKGEFIRQANAVCAKYERRVRALMAGIAAGNEMQLARSITRVLPVIREGNGELRSLRPPSNLQDRFDRWMTIADEEVDAAEKLRDALNSRDRPAIQTAFKRLQAKDIDQDRLARQELGLMRCASRSSG